VIEVEVQIFEEMDSDVVIRVVEQSCAFHGLSCALKSTLATYPGSLHWHFKRGGQKGTLEITWWEQASRLWFKVSKGRTADWIMETIPSLKEQIEKSLL